MGGECVKVGECPDPVICDENEIYKPCIKPCEASCKYSMADTGICTAECESKCVCKSGFVRDDQMGKCIKKDSCPPPKCGHNEEFVKCNGNKFRCESMCLTEESEDYENFEDYKIIHSGTCETPCEGNVEI